MNENKRYLIVIGILLIVVLATLSVLLVRDSMLSGGFTPTAAGFRFLAGASTLDPHER